MLWKKVGTWNESGLLERDSWHFFTFTNCLSGRALVCLIANSGHFILAGFLSYHSDFISIIFTFLLSSICFDESSSFGEQSNKKKSDTAHFITAFSVIYFSLIFSMQILSRYNWYTGCILAKAEPYEPIWYSILKWNCSAVSRNLPSIN